MREYCFVRSFPRFNPLCADVRCFSPEQDLPAALAVWDTSNPSLWSPRVPLQRGLVLQHRLQCKARGAELMRSTGGLGTRVV